MAPVDPALLAILACPRCGGGLSAAAGQRALRCADCGAIYPVNEAGVPIMTVEDD